MRIGCTNNRRAATTLLWGAISPRAAALGPTNQRAGGMQVRPELRGLGGRMRVLTELAAAVLTLKTDERFAFLMIDDHRCSAAGLACVTDLTDGLRHHHCQLDCQRTPPATADVKKHDIGLSRVAF